MAKRKTQRVPARGPLPRPESSEEAREFLKKAAFPAPRVDSVTAHSEEFTSLCPVTGQPDFATLTIDYTPNLRCLESRALKYYLWSFREEAAFCETLAARIADDIVYAVDPKLVTVEVAQNVRGGISIVASATRVKS